MEIINVQKFVIQNFANFFVGVFIIFDLVDLLNRFFHFVCIENVLLFHWELRLNKFKERLCVFIVSWIMERALSNDVDNCD